MVGILVLSLLAQTPRVHGFLGGDIGVASTLGFNSGGWGPAAELGVQLSDELSIYAAARVSTLLIVFSPTHVLGAAFVEYRTPWRIGFALGAGWLYSHEPSFVGQREVDFSGPAFPLRVLYDFDNHVRVVMEAGVSPNLLPHPAGTTGWGSLSIGYCWR